MTPPSKSAEPSINICVFHVISARTYTTWLLARLLSSFERTFTILWWSLSKQINMWHCKFNTIVFKDLSSNTYLLLSFLTSGERPAFFLPLKFILKNQTERNIENKEFRFPLWLKFCMSYLLSAFSSWKWSWTEVEDSKLFRFRQNLSLSNEFFIRLLRFLSFSKRFCLNIVLC